MHLRPTALSHCRLSPWLLRISGSEHDSSLVAVRGTGARSSSGRASSGSSVLFSRPLPRFKHAPPVVGRAVGGEARSSTREGKLCSKTRARAAGQRSASARALPFFSANAGLPPPFLLPVLSHHARSLSPFLLSRKPVFPRPLSLAQSRRLPHTRSTCALSFSSPRPPSPSRRLSLPHRVPARTRPCLATTARRARPRPRCALPPP